MNTPESPKDSLFTALVYVALVAALIVIVRS
jgi:hypothetical protein